MTIEKTVTDNEIILKLDGWLDTESAPELNAELEAFDSDDKKLVFDMEKLEYISSSGIRQIIFGYKKMNGYFLLKNVPESIMKILKDTGLDKKIDIE